MARQGSPCYSDLLLEQCRCRMPTLQAEQLRAIAAALMHLRGDTLNSVGAATGIRSANLSVWLRGKEQVISAPRVAALLYHLGIEGQQLRADMLHRWRDFGALDDLKQVLKALVRAEAAVLYQDCQPGLTKTRFLQIGETLVRVELTPGIAEASDLVDLIQPRRVITLPEPLSSLPIDQLPATREALLTLAEQAACEIGDDELLDGLLFRLSNTDAMTVAINSSGRGGWQKLEQALRSAIRLGVDPTTIAAWIENGKVAARRD